MSSGHTEFTLSKTVQQFYLFFLYGASKLRHDVFGNHKQISNLIQRTLDYFVNFFTLLLLAAFSP